MRQLKLRWVIVMIAAVLGTLANAGLALGQATNSGTVVGEVTDASGAVIPGATVVSAAGVNCSGASGYTSQVVIR